MENLTIVEGVNLCVSQKLKIIKTKNILWQTIYIGKKRVHISYMGTQTTCLAFSIEIN